MMGEFKGTSRSQYFKSSQSKFGILFPPMAEKESQIKKLQSERKKRNNEALPQLFAVLFTVWGLSISLFANIIHDFVKDLHNSYIYTFYVLCVCLVYISFALTIWYWLKKTYTDPVEKIEKQIEDLKKNL